jgi:hypothetical protein
MMTTEEVWGYLTAWAEQYAPDFYALLTAEPAYTKAILSIGRGIPKPRKDIAVWSEFREYMAFFFDELFTPGSEYPENVPAEDLRAVLMEYQALYDEHDDRRHGSRRSAIFAPPTATPRCRRNTDSIPSFIKATSAISPRCSAWRSPAGSTARICTK